MPGCLDDGGWNGLEEVTEVTEGIGMGGGDWKISNTLELQKLGGFESMSFDCMGLQGFEFISHVEMI